MRLFTLACIASVHALRLPPRLVPPRQKFKTTLLAEAEAAAAVAGDESEAGSAVQAGLVAFASGTFVYVAIVEIIAKELDANKEAQKAADSRDLEAQLTAELDEEKQEGDHERRGMMRKSRSTTKTATPNPKTTSLTMTPKRAPAAAATNPMSPTTTSLTSPTFPWALPHGSRPSSNSLLIPLCAISTPSRKVPPRRQ